MRASLFGAFLTILLATALVAGCGLQDYEYLQPPISSSSGTGASTLIAFTHNTLNSSSDFRGYEVYYKLYLSTDLSSSPPAAASDAARIEASWSSVYPDQIIKRIKDSGYVSVAASTSSPVVSLKTPPLVSISSADVAKIIQASINLYAGVMTVDIAGTASTFYVARNTTSTDSVQYPTFDHFVAGGDCDSTTSGSHFWIRAYAFGYGLDSNLTSFYGMPSVVADTVLLY